MKDITLSIEKGWRSFNEKNQSISQYCFYVIQFNVLKEKIKSGYYELILKNQSHQINRRIKVDYENNRIVDLKSHEDPLVQNEKYIMLSFHIHDSTIHDAFPLKGQTTVKLKCSQSNKIIASHHFPHIENVFTHSPHSLSRLNNYEVSTTTDCVLRLHLGKENGEYSEEMVDLKKGDRLCVKSYLSQYSYVGVQLSYSHLHPEVEEKYILNGLKGMRLSGDYVSSDGRVFYGLLPYQSKYKMAYVEEGASLNDSYVSSRQESWVSINHWDELIYILSKTKTLPVFEVSPHFLLSVYSSYDTYSQLGFITEAKHRNNIGHYTSRICQECEFFSYCLQLVPSALSREVMKHTMSLSSYRDCDIAKIVGSAMIES